ncbi:bud site selection protein [Cyclospora cayetanensis]|uniref:Bud site selection protein n=1 Tax=Cyclospora cayetanensis TaxID=88456 RepID=A0A1D3D044_9EIME|nr:bud site selection protein [Cyclospora cayetanensis]
MGRRQKAAKGSKNRKLKRGTRDLKRRTLDQDQAHKAVSAPSPSLPVDEDLPGAGQHLCRACSRYFINKETLEKHCSTKGHKRRLAAALEAPWSTRQAESCRDPEKKALPQLAHCDIQKRRGQAVAREESPGKAGSPQRSEEAQDRLPQYSRAAMERHQEGSWRSAGQEGCLAPGRGSNRCLPYATLASSLSVECLASSDKASTLRTKFASQA